MFTGEQIRNEENEENAINMIRSNMNESSLWLARGIVAIFMKQTEDEQRSEDTKYHNSVGFGATDAKILTSFAKQCQNWLNGKSKFDQPLSSNQSVIAKRLMKKYAGQLLKIAKGTI